MKTILLFLSFLGFTLNGFAQYYEHYKELPKKEAEKYEAKGDDRDQKIALGENVIWVDSSFVCIKIGTNEEKASLNKAYISALPLMINGKVTTNPTPLAKEISKLLLDKDFCQYISSLSQEDITRKSIFWVHIKGDLDIPVVLWNILHPERQENSYFFKNAFKTSVFDAFDITTVRYKEKIGNGFCFFLTTGDSWGIAYFKNAEDFAYDGWTWRVYHEHELKNIKELKKIDKSIIDGWFEMLPFPPFPKELKQKVLLILKDKSFRGGLFYY